jgi:hypothetical protein
MRFIRHITRRSWLASSLATALVIGVTGLGSRPAMAHEAPCPYCKLILVQDTPQLDNEVVLRYGRKRIEYRCVFCALAQTKSQYQGDLTILAPSELKGKPVTLARKDGKWSVTPETAVFVGEKVDHRQCSIGYRALSSRAAFDAWVKRNQPLLGSATPKTLDQMVEISK